MDLDAGSAVTDDESVWIDEQTTYSWEQWEALRKRVQQSANRFNGEFERVGSALAAIAGRLRELGGVCPACLGEGSVYTIDLEEVPG